MVTADPMGAVGPDVARPVAGSLPARYAVSGRSDGHPELCRPMRVLACAILCLLVSACAAERSADAASDTPPDGVRDGAFGDSSADPQPEVGPSDASEGPQDVGDADSPDTMPGDTTDAEAPDGSADASGGSDADSGAADADTSPPDAADVDSGVRDADSSAVDGDTGAVDSDSGPVDGDAGGPDSDTSPPDAADDAGHDIAPPVCPEVTPTAIAEYGLPTEIGRYEATTRDGFQDDYLYDAGGTIKVGVRREWGGSVVFFGLTDGTPGMGPANTIDANDTGRELQVAFYDPDRIMQGCAWNASCRSGGVACPTGIRYLGWNPVQGGNRCNVGSGVEGLSHSGGVMTATTIPRHWNPDWDLSECSGDGCGDPGRRSRPSDVRVTQRMRFVSMHVVEFDYTLENLSDLDHAPTNQELPTLYSSNGRGGPDLWRLFDASGRHVPIDTPTSGSLDGFFYENYESPGPWSTLQNDTSEYGVGLLHENGLSAFQGWQHRGVPFNNFRGRFEFGIPARGTVRARVYLLIGSLGTITSEADWLQSHLPPFGAVDAPAEGAAFDGTVSVQGWALDNRGVSQVFARIDGAVEVPLTYGDARPDVCLVWPGYPGCGTVGFSGEVDLRAVAGGARCAHGIEVVAVDGDGNERSLGHRSVRPR